MPVIFCKILNELLPFIYVTISFPLDILRKAGQNMTNMTNFVCTSTLTIPSLGLLPIFLQNFDGVTALDLRQNFVSAQYLEKGWTESDQILYAHQH